MSSRSCRPTESSSSVPAVCDRLMAAARDWAGQSPPARSAIARSGSLTSAWRSPRSSGNGGRAAAILCTLARWQVAGDGLLRPGIELRSLESGEIRLLSGTALGRTPFWSPDSRTIAFFADRKLKTVAVSGGPPRTVCEDTGIGGGGTWNAAGTIVFATEAGVLTRVSTQDGTCTELTKQEPGVIRRVPVFLPDGDHFLFAMIRTDETRQGLYVASLADPAGRRLLADMSSALFVPNTQGSNRGRLLFVREETLMAQAFDATSHQLSGDPVAVADQVSFTATIPEIAASADANGTLIYLANSQPNRQLVWYDRSGAELGRAAMTGVGGDAVSLAPDGTRVVFGRYAQGTRSLWLQDLTRNYETRFTVPPSVIPGPAVWSPDGQRLAFSATRTDPGIHIKHVGSSTSEVLLQGMSPLVPSDWSRDGHWLVYSENHPNTGADIWILHNPSTATTARKPVALLNTPYTESQAQISPDGKWLAYYSNETGTGQVFLRPFHGQSFGSEMRWQLSTINGIQPRWRADATELFYLERLPREQRFRVMSVPIRQLSTPGGTPKALFEIRTRAVLPQANSFLYSPTSDGQRFLINVNATEARPSLELIMNWGKHSD